MKKQFFDHLHTIMKNNKDVYFLTGGLGYPRIDEFLEKYPDRAFNCEASEQTMLDMAVGLSYAGKTPIVYSITPFLLYRPFETWRTYINHENLHVIGVGVGRDDEYSQHDGFSHDASDDFLLFPEGNDYFEGATGILDNIKMYRPETEKDMKQVLDEAISRNSPVYINIKRG